MENYAPISLNLRYFGRLEDSWKILETFVFCQYILGSSCNMLEVRQCMSLFMHMLKKYATLSKFVKNLYIKVTQCVYLSQHYKAVLLSDPRRS